MRILSLVLGVLLLCFSEVAFAQSDPMFDGDKGDGAQASAPKPEDTGPGVHSINVSPLGLVFGSYLVNYEYLLAGYNGFLVEGDFSSDSDGGSSATSYGLGAGYRLHWRGQQNSGFLGIQTGYSVGSAEATVSTSGVNETFELDITTVYLIPNIGKRWAWDFGLNLTLRGGIGWAKHTVSSNRDEEGVQEAIDQINDLLEFIPVAIDAELSLGWIF